MKLWIIGRRGMLSQSLQRICNKKKIEYLATSRKEVDVTDENALNKQFQTLAFTHVINCSGYTAVDQAEQEQEIARQLNVNAVETLGCLTKEKGIRIIHFSTDYVFDGKRNVPYSEETQTKPLSVYGQTKREGEEKLMAINPSACIIRSSWVFGLEGNHFVQTMIQLMKQHETLRVVSDQRGSPTFCEDLACATIDLLDHQGIYHFANSGQATWLEFAEEILKHVKEKIGKVKCQGLYPTSSEEYSALAKRPAFSVLKTDKYAKTIKKKPRHWQDCLKEYFEGVSC